ncbi:MAG TPA: hypothetical protein VD963_11030 [Phycisphaerales bacterium]|nr:hypothetical protein [Phycisphaerales bacterium]
MTRPSRARRAGVARAAAAFSLIEIMISVLILALGLLGIGAIFPVVIRQQRLGSEATMGALASGSTKAVLSNLQSLDRTVWARWRDDAATPVGGLGPSPANRPFLGHGPDGINAWRVPDIDAEGGVVINLDWDQANAGNQLAIMPVADRLFPRGLAGVDPQLVWDYAIQRVRDGDALDRNDALRVAVFVRRLDPRIRVPRGFTLGQVLTDGPGLPAADERLPVGVSAAGLPTGDGTGTYAAPVTMDVAFHFDPADDEHKFRDRLVAATPPPTTPSDPMRIRWQLLAQVGQRLVDNLGNVYEVVAADMDEDGEPFVRVSPPVPAWIQEDQATPVGGTGGMIRQVVFTPQVPADVILWTVKP